MRQWTFIQAKEDFEAILDAALAGEPQLISRSEWSGKQKFVVVLPLEMYENLKAAKSISRDVPKFHNGETQP